jgi:hypothetical protein
MISSYGEISGFSPVSGVELAQVNGGDVKIDDIIKQAALKAVCKTIAIVTVALKPVMPRK